ncbi:hypothetical protein [Streptomyces sp. NPDC127197]|uniref:hypothetical protein n=1 Tax=Streptomyces sp. NPDC127197 TaxID=3345388 RepID=UPI0036313F96
MTMSAEAAWTSARNGSASGWTAADSPKVSVDRQGDALLTWTAGDLSTTYSYQRVQTRAKFANGTKGAIRTLSPDGASMAWPKADSDDTGDSAVAWEQDSHPGTIKSVTGS